MPQSRKQAAPKPHARKGRALLLYTGGTIGMDEKLRLPHLTSDVLRKRLLTHVPELQQLAHCDVDILFNRDSAHIGPKEWVAIADRIRSKWRNYDGVVVMHGTDTLAYTASALSFLLRPCLKPVVLTGAQRPLAASITDAKRNLISAVEIAMRGPRQFVSQVTVFFDDHLLQGNRSRKRSALDFEAFESPKAEILATLGTEIRYHRERALHGARRAEPKLLPRFSDRVILLHLTPGFPARLVKEQLLSSLDALILVVFPSGTGTTHDPEFNQLLRSARRLGVEVILVTEGVGESAGPAAYEAGKKFLEEDCLWAHDMTPECAYIKASLLLGQPKAKAQFRKLWKKDFAGEGV
jgi:L-asparaginase